MAGPLDTREVTFEGFAFEFNRLDVAQAWAREVDAFSTRGDLREVARTFAGFHLPSAADFAGVLNALGRAQESLSDLKARAVVHSPPSSRRRVARLTESASHVLYADDFPEFLTALATGKVKHLRARAYASLTRAQAAYLSGSEDLDAEADRQAAVVAACDLALHALDAQDPEALRKAEKALRRAGRSRSHTGSRAYSRTRRRGPCSKPSRHLTQAVRRTHAPPPMRDGNHVEGAA